MIVLDASLVVEWLTGNTERSATPHLQDILLNTEIIVPAHWPIEISNFLRSQLGKKLITTTHLQVVWERLDLLQIIVDAPIDIEEVAPLAIFSSEHDLTSYDGAYVQLAFHHKAVLATLDVAMRRAAQRLDIALLPA